LRKDVSIKYIAPRLKKGKSDKYLRSPKEYNKTFDNSIKKFEEDFCIENENIEG